MAIMDNTNTTGTIERASALLGKKCDATQENMKRLMAEAGCEEYKVVRVMLPLIPGCKDDVIFIGLNGASFYFMRGKTVEMPEPLMEILRNTGEI